MGKVSKNARTNRQAQEGSKDFVKVIMTNRSPKTGAYQFREKIVHKDLVQDYVKSKSDK